MNFNLNNQNTLLTKKVAALYEAMQKAGDSGLAFMVVDSLNAVISKSQDKCTLSEDTPACE